MQRVVYFVGTEAEVAHHAAPLRSHFDIHIVAADEIISKAQPNELVVFFSEHFDRFRDAIAKLKARNIATLYLIDGILEWRNAWENRSTEPACPYTMRPVLAHKVACIGDAQARTLKTWGNESKIETTGIARFDELREKWLKSRDRNLVQPSTTKTDFRVLVMTAKTPGFTEDQISATKQSLIDLRDFFQANRKVDSRKIKVTWRLTQGLAAEIGVKNEIDDLSGNELAMVLQRVDAVISSPSTAMVEAMLFGKPVAALDYHQCPNYLQTAWTISARDQIESVIQELADPPARRILFQQAQLDDAVFLTQSATERLSQLIQAMLAVVDQSLNEDKPLHFPANMLCDANQASQLYVAPRLNHTEVYPNVDEFHNSDLLELQSQLSHSRREIEHLKRETTRLESELGQAHEIFEQIHSHPIAGPIVRLREKFMQFFQRSTKTEHAGHATPDNATTSTRQSST